MNEISLLRETLRCYFPWHGARLSFLAQFLIALYRVKTVNLAEIATGFVGPTQVDSHYKRLQRFFRDFDLDTVTFAQAVVLLMAFPQPWVLCFDRTQWQFGQHPHNILMLGIAHEGVAFPIVWSLLPKRGSSNTSERVNLIEQFLAIFPRETIAYLSADREFLGQEWFGYLMGSKLPFRIRIRYSDKLSDGRRNLPARVLFAELQPGQTKVLAKRRRLWGRWLHVAALRSTEGQLVVIVSTDSPQTALADYAKRWQIETLFGCLKGRGFDLEATHLEDAQRLSKLIALLTLALCWTCRTGVWRHQLKPLTLKKHGRKAKSFFRYGLDFLRNIVLNLGQKLPQFKQTLQFLSCT